MDRLFFVLCTRGDGWDRERAAEEQDGWAEHDAFMAALARDGVVTLSGPLEGTPNYLVLVRARSEDDVRAKLGDDVWARKDILRVERVAPWSVKWRS
jgi:uncharacterized protein YciI